jgi:WD40 repeat protein
MNSTINHHPKQDQISPTRLRNQKTANRCLCSICKNILPLSNSQTCTKCGEQFCMNCINYEISINGGLCPAQGCGEPYIGGILMKTIKSEIEELEIKCKFSGCENYIQLRDLNNHESLCSYKQQLCQYCKNIFDSEKIEEHKLNCTERIVECANCFFKDKFNNSNHDCRIFRHLDVLYKKLEEMENKFIKIEKMIRMPKRLGILRKGETNSKMTTKNKQQRMLRSNTNTKKIIEESDENELDINQNFEKIKVNLGTNRLTTVSEFIGINDSLLVGTLNGDIRLYIHGKLNFSYCLKHEGVVTKILDLQTDKKEFISAGRDSKLILRKIDDEIYYDEILQEFYSSHLERTNNPYEIITVDEDELIRFWDLKTKCVTRKIKSPSISCLENLQIKNNSNFLLLSQDDDVVYLYDLEYSRASKSFENEFEIVDLLFYKENLFLTLDNKSRICLWDTNYSTSCNIFTYSGEGSINYMFIYKRDILAFVTTYREIYFIDLTKNDYNILNNFYLLKNNGEYPNDNFYYGKNTNNLTLYTNKGSLFHQFKFN